MARGWVRNGLGKPNESNANELEQRFLLIYIILYYIRHKKCSTFELGLNWFFLLKYEYWVITFNT